MKIAKLTIVFVFLGVLFAPELKVNRQADEVKISVEIAAAMASTGSTCCPHPELQCKSEDYTFTYSIIVLDATNCNGHECPPGQTCEPSEIIG